MKNILELLSKQTIKEMENEWTLNIDEEEITVDTTEDLSEKMDIHSEQAYTDIESQTVTDTSSVLATVDIEEDQISKMDLGDFIISQEEKEEILTNVLSDIGITAVESPFRTFSDDKQEFGGAANYVDLRRVIQKYQNGDITDRILKILDIVIQHKNITSRQIWQMYMLKYHRYIKREHLKRTLDHMVEDGLVGQFRIASTLGHSLYYVYTPEYNGVRLYSAIEDENINWKKTDSVQKPYNVKRCLAANQFLIAFLKNYEVTYKMQERLVWTNGDSKDKGGVRPTLELTSKQENVNGVESIVFLVEVIRKYQGWEEQFKNKLERYAGYLESVEDTRELKKYYIIVCAESDEQLAEAIRQFYEVLYIKRVRTLKDSMFYFISDIDLLDGSVEEDLLHNLQGVVYDFEKKTWIEHKPDFIFAKKDWHNLNFEVDIIRNEEKVNQNLELGGNQENSKEKLAVRIYKIMVEEGHLFPLQITKAAVLLKWKGINYQELGYKKLKQLFVALSQYYELKYESPTELMIVPTEELKKLIKNNQSRKSNLGDSENESTEQPSKKEKEGGSKVSQQDSSSSVHQREGDEIDYDIIKDYIIEGMAGKGKWSQQLRGSIYCKNWDMTAAILNKLTNIYDFTAEGWYNIIAYSYHMAKTRSKIRISGEYLCFDTGIRSSSYEKVYLLARENARINPKWVLLGIATENSKNLGEIIKTEFGASNQTI